MLHDCIPLHFIAVYIFYISDTYNAYCIIFTFEYTTCFIIYVQYVHTKYIQSMRPILTNSSALWSWRYCSDL